MNEKEVGELRRRYRSDRTGITHIRGCYINERREIVAEFDQSLGMMTEDENERFLTLLRRTLSGTLGKNLRDLSFSTQQVMSGSAHRLLMQLRDSKLADDEAVRRFYETVSQSLDLEGSCLLLLAHDAYDVPFHSKDGDEQEDASDEVFSYILCSICPVKQTKPALSYYIHENEFHTRAADWLVSAPEAGFLFPAFDNRSTNLYNALFYTRDAALSHGELIDAVFQCEAPMPAAAQKENFQALLCETLEEECSYEVVQSVREQLCDMIALHKDSKDPEPLTVTGREVQQVLRASGVTAAKLENFATRYDETFGTDAELSPRNLVEPKKYELRTPDVTIQVNPERSDLVQTRLIDGVRYLLIRADETVELNGVSLRD